MTTTDPIDRVVLTHLRIPFKEPFRISGIEVSIRDAILVEVSSASITGLGEAAPMTVLTGDGGDGIEATWSELNDRIAPTLLGHRLAGVEDIGAIAGSWGAGPFASAGAETALWDLFGQMRHASIAELLGATDLRIDMGVEAGLAVGLHASIVEMVKTIESHLTAGYRRVKIEIRPGQDIELVRAVRQHFGDVPLMVDACGTYTMADLDTLRVLDEFDLLMIEQPMAPDDLDGLSALQSAIITPICLDESVTSYQRVEEAIQRGAGRIVNLKLQRLGGLGPSRAIHDLCYGNGWQCWVGSMPELGIGQAHSIHLATLPNCKYPADLEPSARWFVDDYTVPLVEMTSPGMIAVPTRPGLGYHVDPVKVRRYQVRQKELTTPSPV